MKNKDCVPRRRYAFLLTTSETNRENGFYAKYEHGDNSYIYTSLKRLEVEQFVITDTVERIIQRVMDF